MEENGRKVQKVQPSLNNLGMANRDIDPTAQLLTVPGFTPVSGNAGSQDRCSYSLSAKELFQPFDYVMLVGVNRKHLALAATCKLGFHFFDQRSLFRVGLVPV